MSTGPITTSFKKKILKYNYIHEMDILFLKGSCKPMEFIIQKDSLINTITTVSKAVSPRTTIPALTGIKLVAQNEGITLTASDSDLSIEEFIPVEKEGKVIIDMKEPGSIILPARYFGEIIRKMPGDQVKIKTNPQLTITITAGKSEFHLNGMDAADYPRLPQIEENQMLSLPADLLKTMIRQTAFAVATTETRPILTGVLWKLVDSQLTFIATDSHRLTMRQAIVESPEDLTFENVVIPGKSLTELSKILPDDQRLVDIVITDNQILAKIDHTLFYSRVLDGTFPDTSRIIPKHGKTIIKLNTKEFLGAIERASLLAREGKNNVVNLVTGSNQTVEIYSVTPEIGKVMEEVNPISVEGDSLRIAFNAKYMIDALRAVDSEAVEVSFTGAMSPFIIRPTDYDKILHLILPIRTNQ